MKNSLLRIETLSGPPITIRDAQIHVRSQVVQLGLPFLHGGLIWNRPVAVVVRAEDGEEKILPIPDVTRTAIFTMAGLCFTAMLVRMFFKRK